MIAGQLISGHNCCCQVCWAEGFLLHSHRLGAEASTALLSCGPSGMELPCLWPATSASHPVLQSYLQGAATSPEKQPDPVFHHTPKGEL